MTRHGTPSLIGSISSGWIQAIPPLVAARISAWGAPLARAEAQIAIPLLFERSPGLRLDPQHPIEHKSARYSTG
jgi:hypothetical protein